MGWSVSLLRPGFLVVALAAAAIAVGCGGDDDEPAQPVDAGATGPTGAVSQETFIEQGDRICAESNLAIAQLTAGDLDSEAVVGQVLSITEGQVSSLRSLGDPPEDADTYSRFLAAMDDVVEALERQELAAERGEDASAVVSDLEEARTEAAEAAEDFGFEDCGQEGEPLELDGEGDTDAPDQAPAPAPAPTPEAPAEPAPAPAPAPAPPSGGTGDSPSGDGGGGGGDTGGVRP